MKLGPNPQRNEVQELFRAKVMRIIRPRPALVPLGESIDCGWLESLAAAHRGGALSLQILHSVA
jgi:hypothetical protein